MALEFATTFKALTDKEPFPWQTALYENWFSQGKIPPAATLPTGLGKTSVIAIWLIALANKCDVPRRLVYVVNRRTVVDQTTDEVEKYKKAKVAGIDEFALSTLRGQFADNREWSADPSRPAVICGTVDMIGSRLLFSGYGIGRGSRPLHAGFLGQDALLIHDEAHLEPAFQTLLESIVAEQDRCKEFGTFRVMELTATSRGEGKPFELTEEDFKNDIVQQRVHAAKKLHLHPLIDAKKPQKELSDKALSFKDTGKAILIFAYGVETVLAVQEALARANQRNVKTLTGTMRGKERDELVSDKTFARFLPDVPTDATQGTVYLVCTSAGEVGVNISADHLICDLSTFESMAQRLGRVNRFGKFPECEVHVFYPTEWDDKHALTVPRKKTLELLKPLEGSDVSPAKLSKLPQSARLAAFAPKPIVLPATDILFDAWALTSIKEKLPGRPPVEPYLHGITEYELPETLVAWREEVGILTKELRDYFEPKDLLDTYPIQPKELLKEPSFRALKRFEELAKRHPDHPAWIVDEDGEAEVVTLKELADKDNKKRLERKTILLTPDSGGLKSGMLDGTSAERVQDVSTTDSRCRTWNDENDPEGMVVVFEIDTKPEKEEVTTGRRFLYWWSIPKEGSKAAKEPVEWRVHVGDVEKRAEAIVANLLLSDDLKQAIRLAAKFHDHGKRRKQFQTVLGNFKYPQLILAKSGGKSSGRIKESYRHEFGSLLDIPANELSQLNADMQELVLHLIAAHHGRARPHFPADEVFDPDRTQQEATDMAMSVPQRFGRLQRKYGRWGLAYLESLLRAADWAASAEPSKYLNEEADHE